MNNLLVEKKSNTLNEKSTIKPTDTFPDNNLVYRIAHFIQKYRVNRFFQHVPFTIFRSLSVILGYQHAVNGHPQLSKTWKFLYSQKFLEKSLPEIAVIQAGKDNRYGHPHPEVLARLEEFDIDILRTDQDGDIKIFSDGNNIQILNSQF